MDGTQARVEELVQLIRKHRDAYYNRTPLISDAAYDALEDELRSLDPENPLLQAVGTPVLDEPLGEWDKARHAIPMGSLNKAVDEEELRKWAARCDELAQKDGLPPISPSLLVTEKLDGLSVAVTYEGGELKDAITRGDGIVGERITRNARRMKGVPGKLGERASVTVRGEIIFRLSDLKKVFPGAINARNLAAGTTKRHDGQYCDHLSVFFYDLDGEDFPREEQKLERLRALGLLVPWFGAGDVEAVVQLHRQYAEGKRAALDYEIDGLVVRANDVHAQHMLGEKGGRPRAAVAYKFASQAKISKVVEIWWETGPSGRVSPVARVEPIELAGAIVKRASLHNASNVAALGIGVGDEVLVSRRNDVIPYVEEVVKKVGPQAVPPEKCATCGAPLQKVGEYLVCRNKECLAIVTGRIQNWLGVQGVLEWGEKLILQLVEAKLVKEPSDLYRLKVEDIANLERRGELSAQKCVDNLKAQLPLSLPVFLAALAVEGFGLQTAKAIVAGGFDTLEKVQQATFEELSVLPGVGPAKAKAAVEGLKEREGEIARLLEVGVVPVSRAAQGPLAGKTFCFTGALSRPRKELEQMVTDLGGTLLSSVTKDLKYLVMADPESGSSKAQKAKKYGTQCLDEAQFLALVDAARENPQ